jgi:alpha-tubulin suppressor-like RCC1 family protein
MRTLWALAVVGLLVAGCTSSSDAGVGVESEGGEDITAFPDNPFAPDPDISDDSSESGSKDAGDAAGEDVADSSAQDVGGTSGEDAADPDDAETGEAPDIDAVVDVCADEANDCSALNVDPGGCVEVFTCDPDFTDEEGSHCKPVFKASGSPCVGSLDGQSMVVIATTEPATDETPSTCDRFVCHEEVDAPPTCVQASTLPTTIQFAMEIEGFFVKDECALEDMPFFLSQECNNWLCGCATEECLDAKCQTVGEHAMLGETCGVADMCSSGTCITTPDESYSCEQEPVECPAVWDAWCVEMPACDPETGGCPEAMDALLSDAKCSTGDPCLLSGVCEPDHPDADAMTGCVLVYDDPESGCGDGIVGIAGGGSHTFAWEADGTLHGWGIQNYGLPPEGVLFAQVSAGKSHSCGVDKGNNLHCWGISNEGNWDYGQVTLTPTEGKYVHASAGYNHSCAVREDGTAVCWGIGSVDDLTPEQEPYEKGQVKLTPTGPVFQQIGAGHGHSCGLKLDGSLECWGNPNATQNVPAGSDFVSLSVGFHHNCAIDSQGGMACWGWTAFGLVEDAPVGIFQSVSCGYGHACAVRTTGEVVCWGVPNKAEGAPPITDQGQVTGAPVIANFKHVGVDSSHSCAVTTDNKVVCWGSDGGGKSTPPLDLQP